MSIRNKLSFYSKKADGRPAASPYKLQQALGRSLALPHSCCSNILIKFSCGNSVFTKVY